MTSMEHSRIMQLEFSKAKPRRPGGRGKRADIKIFEDIGEDDELPQYTATLSRSTVTEGLDSSISTLLSKPAKRRTSTIDTACYAPSAVIDAKNMPRHAVFDGVYSQGYHLGQEHDRPPTIAKTQTAAKSSKTSFNSSKSNDTPAKIVSSIAPMAESISCQTRCARVSLASAPRRLPMQASRVINSNVPAIDRPGPNTGKENRPPGLETAQSKDPLSKQHHTPHASKLLIDACSTYPLKYNTALNCSPTRSAQKLLRTKIPSAFGHIHSDSPTGVVAAGAKSVNRQRSLLPRLALNKEKLSSTDAMQGTSRSDGISTTLRNQEPDHHTAARKPMVVSTPPSVSPLQSRIRASKRIAILDPYGSRPSPGFNSESTVCKQQPEAWLITFTFRAFEAASLLNAGILLSATVSLEHKTVYFRRDALNAFTTKREKLAALAWYSQLMKYSRRLITYSA